MKQSGVPIQMALLHQAVHWPGVCATDKTLSDFKVKGLIMELVPQGLLLKCKDQLAIIPSANVAIAVVNKDFKWE